MCFQLVLVITERIQFPETPYFFAIAFSPNPIFLRLNGRNALEYISLILGISFAVSFLTQLFLSFNVQSREFSNCVPEKRWDFLTQVGLSHLWQIDIPFAIGPFSISQTTRCAGLEKLLKFILPYPAISFAPVHIQQLEVFLTYFQKRLEIGFILVIFAHFLHSSA